MVSEATKHGLEAVIALQAQALALFHSKGEQAVEPEVIPPQQPMSFADACRVVAELMHAHRYRIVPSDLMVVDGQPRTPLAMVLTLSGHPFPENSDLKSQDERVLAHMNRIFGVRAVNENFFEVLALSQISAHCYSVGGASKWLRQIAAMKEE